jgi:hypothetical protein
LLCGRDDEVLHWADKAASFGMPVAMPPQTDIRAQLAHRAGRHAEAATLWKHDCSPEFRAAGAPEAIDLVCAAIQDPALRLRASASLRALEERLPPPDLTQVIRKRLIVWYAMLGELDAAHALMDRSLTDFAQRGFVGSAWGALWMQELRPFRRDPRFQLVAQRLGLFAYWERFGPPDGHEVRAGVLTADWHRS